MTISELLQYCMAKPGAEQSVHSDWKATQIKVEVWGGNQFWTVTEWSGSSRKP